MSLASLKARAERVFVTTQGDEIRYRRLLAADVADLPDAWTIYNVAIYYALRQQQPKPTNGEETTPDPWLARFDKATKAFDERQSNKVALICRAALEPRIVDPTTLKGKPVPDDAVPYYALSQLDMERFAREIIIHASGLEPSEQEEQARRISRFPDGADVPADDEGGGEKRGAGGEPPGDRRPVAESDVDPRGGDVGVDDEGEGAARSDAEAGAKEDGVPDRQPQ